MRNLFKITYPNRWISRGGQFREHQIMTPLDFFLYSRPYMKTTVYGTPVTSEEDLIARVHGATESFTRQPHLLGHVCEALLRRCMRLCNDVGGTQFELVCNICCSMCCTCSVYWLHVERTLRCSTAPKPCGSEQEFRLEKSVRRPAQHTKHCQFLGHRVYVY